MKRTFHGPDSSHTFQVAASACLCQQLLRFDQVFRSIGIEKGINRLAREIDLGKPVSCCETVDLADVIIDHGLAQCACFSDWPKPKNRMGPPGGSSTGEVGPLIFQRLNHSCHEIFGQKGRIGRDGRDPTAIRVVRFGPIHTGQDAGKRSGKSFDDIRYHRKAEVGETRWITVGVQHEMINLMSASIDHMRENRSVRQVSETLVSAAHAPCLTASQKNADNA